MRGVLGVGRLKLLYQQAQENYILSPDLMLFLVLASVSITINGFSEANQPITLLFEVTEHCQLEKEQGK